MAIFGHFWPFLAIFGQKFGHSGTPGRSRAGRSWLILPTSSLLFSLSGGPRVLEVSLKGAKHGPRGAPRLRRPPGPAPGGPGRGPPCQPGSAPGSPRGAPRGPPWGAPGGPRDPDFGRFWPKMAKKWPKKGQVSGHSKIFCSGSLVVQRGRSRYLKWPLTGSRKSGVN